MQIQLVKPGKPWCTVEDVELATGRWVKWFKHRHLCQHCRDIPPIELETTYYAQRQRPGAGRVLRPERLQTARSGSGRARRSLSRARTLGRKRRAPQSPPEATAVRSNRSPGSRSTDSTTGGTRLGARAATATNRGYCGESPGTPLTCRQRTQLGDQQSQRWRRQSNTGSRLLFVGLRSCARELSPLDDQIFRADGFASKPIFQDLAGSCGVASLCGQRAA